jgi:hypothetical protein
MKSLRLPAAAPSRQMNFLFDNSRLEGVATAERDKIILVLAQILMQAAGLSVKRKAVVYVRQSTQSQVMTNLESKRRQYDLVDVARQRGFVDVEIIDDDLGRSASGTVARPGFDRLVAWLCAGKVGFGS